MRHSLRHYAMAWLIVILFGITTLVLLTSGCVHADGWPTNYQHFKEIRGRAKGCHRGDHLRFTLNDGSHVFGELLRYEGATDYIWYQPQNTTSWWAQDAFDIHEIFSLEIVEPI